MSRFSGKRHIFFDLDDTLWDFQANSDKVLAELFSEFDLAEKLNTDFETFRLKYREVNLDLWSQYYRRLIDKNYMRTQRFNLVFASFNYNDHEENLLISRQYTERAPKGNAVREGCYEILSYLSKKYKLHIITNGFREIQHIKIDACGLREYFSQIIISDEHDLVKPEEKIFRLAESLSNARREECVMIGDSYESDIVGAKNAGWEAIYLKHHFDQERDCLTISTLDELRDYL
jgi:putative hydrolase of the HAD superfamily